jgi:hypothetical protein
MKNIISLKKLKTLSQKELINLMTKLEISSENASFEYNRREAVHIKNVDPDYYRDHFKKIYG